MKGSVLSALLALTPSVLAWQKSECDDIKYTSVPGYFLQDDPNTVNSGFDYVSWNFGLINRTYPTDTKFDPHKTKTQWQRFAQWVKYLNSKCRKSESVTYKVLFMGRHGEGWHNAAESFYGTPAWNCYWSELDGNGTAVWSDAQLTPNGFTQAYKANAYYKSRFQDGLPYFESYYSSPLKRCVQTANVTFSNITLPPARPFQPVIKELLRESISIHTCDRRSTKSEIHAYAPNFKFEHDFTEKDELWLGDKGETSDHQIARSRVVLNDIFTSDDNTWLSITSHSGEIRSLLNVLNHRSFDLSTGQIIPVLVKAEFVEPQTATTTYASFTPEATCHSPPVTSIGGQGCVCSSTATTTAPPKTTATHVY